MSTVLNFDTSLSESILTAANDNSLSKFREIAYALKNIPLPYPQELYSSIKNAAHIFAEKHTNARGLLQTLLLLPPAGPSGANLSFEELNALLTPLAVKGNTSGIDQLEVGYKRFKRQGLFKLMRAIGGVVRGAWHYPIIPPTEPLQRLLCADANGRNILWWYAQNTDFHQHLLAIAHQWPKKASLLLQAQNTRNCPICALKTAHAGAACLKSLGGIQNNWAICSH